MKHKNFVLITFFLTLFVFQQVQAGATMPPKENPSQVSFAPAYAPLPTINVFVLALREDNNAIDYSINGDQPYKCLYAHQYHGCGIIDPTNPGAPNNPVISIPVGGPNDLYLRDVLVKEMDIDEIPLAAETFQAFKAQAVAALTFASWKAAEANASYYSYWNGTYWEGGPSYINNSTDYQVFIPGSYNASTVANKSLIFDAISETQEIRRPAAV